MNGFFLQNAALFSQPPKPPTTFNAWLHNPSDLAEEELLDLVEHHLSEAFEKIRNSNAPLVMGLFPQSENKKSGEEEEEEEEGEEYVQEEEEEEEGDDLGTSYGTHRRRRLPPNSSFNSHNLSGNSYPTVSPLSAAMLDEPSINEERTGLSSQGRGDQFFDRGRLLFTNESSDFDEDNSPLQNQEPFAFSLQKLVGDPVAFEMESEEEEIEFEIHEEEEEEEEEEERNESQLNPLQVQEDQSEEEEEEIEIEIEEDEESDEEIIDD